MGTYFEEYEIEEVTLDEFETEELLETEEDDRELTEEEIQTVIQAYYLCRNEFACIKLAFISERTGFSKKQVIRALEGTYMWEDPLNGEWLTREQLARGNVREKLKYAEEIFEKEGRLYETVKKLRELVPQAPFADEIELSLGAPWIPLFFKKRFIKELTNMTALPEIEYDEINRRYKVIEAPILNQLNNHYIYGTVHTSAVKLIEKILNSSPLRDSEKEGYRDILQEMEKQKMIQEEFVKWVRMHPEVEERLTDIYTEKNGYTILKYDGSHIAPKGLNPKVSLYKRQKDVIVRILENPDPVLIADEVGAGKTNIFEVGVQELLNIGLVHKALIVVPNNVLRKTVENYEYLYPGERFLAIYPEDFKPKYREAILKQMKAPESRLIFMAYSSFHMLEMSKKHYLDQLDQKISRCKAAYQNPQNANFKKNYENKLEKLREERKEILERESNPLACFESIGIDCLVVDECHNYKNITLDSKAGNVIGMHIQGAKKSDELMEIVHDIQKKGGRIIFVSGTPITNSISDIYAMQKFLQPKALEYLNIYSLSDWIATFCKEDLCFEVNVSQGYKLANRITEYNNLPELSALITNVCDYYRIDKSERNLPEHVEERWVMVQRSEALKQVMQELLERTEAVYSGAVDRKEDNLLKVTLDGRLASIDVRLLVPDAQFQEEESKLYRCAAEAAQMYYRYPEKTQIIFSDSATPKKAFNVYDETKRILVEKGIPESEIAFIHEAVNESQRSKLLEKFNEGTIRIMIGSTKKLGTGSNVQKNLVAVHHLDIPWKPGDLEQRNGRIIRDGNSNDRVFIFYYTTQGTFDAFSYQKLESKQKFIDRFFSGTLGQAHRKEGDLEDNALKYAEIKAAVIGDPLIRQRVELTNQLERTKHAKRHRQQELHQFQQMLYRFPEKIRQCTETALRLKSDSAYYQENRAVCSLQERLEFAEELILALEEQVESSQEQLFDVYQGFEIVLPQRTKYEERYILVKRKDGGSYRLELPIESLEAPNAGICMRIDRLLVSLEKRAQEQQGKADAYRQQVEDAQKEMEKGNPFIQEADQLLQKIEEIDELLKEAG